jgi:acyl-CoA thioesterase-1
MRFLSFVLPYGVRHLNAKARALLASLLLLTLAAPLAAQPTPPSRLILALGDSLTAGYMLPASQSFPAQLEAALRKEGRAVTVHNAGVSGDTSAQGRARLEWVLSGLPRKPDVAIVALGANDMLRGQPVQQMEANLDAIVAELKRRNIEVVLAGMLAAPNLGKAYAGPYNAAFPTIAKRHRVLFYPFFMDGVAANPKLLLSDQMHPNREGVGVMVKGILPTVRQALDQSARAAAPPARQGKAPVR